ncbi:hypothetical protein Aau02nite_22890 [Amorphoplanes auranticolor]|uniref:Uncharacterized protein n=1 Tax=Actinoplanes auranticolor TaxID=47988 RepID=A0A919S6D2_9ACTN|nr:hypothetical protein Aau02nite_22890 [Actinoplanes auranticolor]
MPEMHAPSARISLAGPEYVVVIVITFRRKRRASTVLAARRSIKRGVAAMRNSAGADKLRCVRGMEGTENGGPLNQWGRRSQYVDQSGRMFSACGPFWPWVMSNSTFWFSSRLR